VELTELNISCGVHQAFGFDKGRSPEKNLLDICTTRTTDYTDYWMDSTSVKTVTRVPSTGVIVWSHHSSNPGANGLAKYIINNDLGWVTKTEPIRNPNSGNRISVWCWGVDRDALRRKLKEIAPSTKKNKTTTHQFVNGGVIHRLRTQNYTACGLHIYYNRGPVAGVVNCRNCLRVRED
jgi:hypothetical protein